MISQHAKFLYLFVLLRYDMLSTMVHNVVQFSALQIVVYYVVYYVMYHVTFDVSYRIAKTSVQPMSNQYATNQQPVFNVAMRLLNWPLDVATTFLIGRFVNGVTFQRRRTHRCARRRNDVASNVALTLRVRRRNDVARNVARDVA